MLCRMAETRHFRARDELLTLSQASARSGIPKRLLKRLFDEHRVPVEVLALPGRRWRRIRASVLEALMVERKPAA
jgi:hypothetical protein